MGALDCRYVAFIIVAEMTDDESRRPQCVLAIRGWVILSGPLDQITEHYPRGEGIDDNELCRQQNIIRKVGGILNSRQQHIVRGIGAGDIKQTTKRIGAGEIKQTTKHRSRYRDRRY